MCNLESKNIKWIFLKNELFSMSWNASVQHNKVYLENISSRNKAELQSFAQYFIENMILSKYNKQISEKEHCDIIVEISKEIELKYSHILYNGKYKIGTSQKLLNLLLKYYWCIGIISIPPHCPIDRIILSEIGIKNINWTMIDTIEQYKNVILKIKGKIYKMNLSDWELEVWKRRRTTAST